MLNITFIIITLLSVVLCYRGTGNNKKILLISAAWLLISGALALSGFLQNTSAIPPRFLLVFAGGVGLCVWFYRIVRNHAINTRMLLTIHALRLPVELVLYQLFLQKKVPVFMTFTGWNFDILMGISALMILAYILVSRREPPRPFMVAWNILGLVLLTTIVCIAILSAPLPLQQLAFDQPNVAIFEFPFVWLPAVVVPLVYLSHVLGLRLDHRS